MSQYEMFTNEEISSIQALRECLQDLSTDDIAKTYYNDDSIMWRFVLAKSMEENPLQASEAMFRSTMEWKKEIKLDKLCKEWEITGNKRYNSARAHFGTLCFYGGVMKEKSVRDGPILVERLGKMDISGLFSDEYAFDCTSHRYIVYLEEAWQRVVSMGGKTRGMIIIDISGCGFGMLTSISVIKRLSSVGVLRYPEITERVCVVNAGWVIAALWSAIRPFVPTRTQSKFSILDDISSLDGDIVGGVACLPSFVGGDREEGDHPVGPAATVHDAYGAVLGCIAESGSACSYPDVAEFLQACLLHAERQIAGGWYVEECTARREVVRGMLGDLGSGATAEIDSEK